MTKVWRNTGTGPKSARSDNFFGFFDFVEVFPLVVHVQQPNMFNNFNILLTMIGICILTHNQTDNNVNNMPVGLPFGGEVAGWPAS